MSTAETVKAQLQADIAAANAATGKKDATMHDAVASLIEGFGGGEEYFRSPAGFLYTKNMVVDKSEGLMVEPSISSSMFHNATELETFYCDYTGLIGAKWVFADCTKLREVHLPKCTGFWLGNTNAFRNNTALEKVTIGSIGCSVTRMDAGSFINTPAIALEIYVNATTIAEIPTLVTNNVPGMWNADATVIYRNSTTGEVITE